MKLSDLKCVNKGVDIDKYIVFREMVKKNMEHPDWLGDFSKEDLINLLDNGAVIWVYYEDLEPVCSMMLIPSSMKAMQKFELDLDYRDVVDYGSMFVNPRYVGNGLQYQMLCELDDYCKNNGFKFAAGTIHPDNVYSINNLVKDDFKMVGTKEFSRGIRNIYLRCLKDGYIQKIFSFITNGDKYLLLKGSDTDPQFHESFWYVVTGSIEKEDISLEDGVRREIFEETALKVLETKRLPIIFKYESLGDYCIEHVFISKVLDGDIVLNEESIDYKWCSYDEFVDKIKWYGDKNELKLLLTKYKLK